MTCIASNPDITGIGVRAAIYAQNLFSLLFAVRVFWDGRITRNELDAIDQQSSTIMITAFALLFSTIIQAYSPQGLSNVHVTVILNLSWMTSTNIFIYLLVYTHRRITAIKKQEADEKIAGGEKRRPFWLMLDEAKGILCQLTFWLGSCHLTLMAALGIWFWADPTFFKG
ncbi:hypothetical protein H0H87_000936, partial [Tephrocybe sp. NHM501043]